MEWFTENIQTACAADLKAGNAIVQKTLTGESFALRAASQAFLAVLISLTFYAFTLMQASKPTR